MTAPRRGARCEGCEILAPLRGASFFLISSGGFRFASTTGYYLPALRADAHVLLKNSEHAEQPRQRQY